jgi:hypothetical protein
MKRFFLTLFAAALACAQAQQQEGPRQAIIDVKYADVNQLSNMLRGVFGTGVMGNPTLKVITVTSDPATVAAVTAAVKRFDVPPQPQPDVELTVYLISGMAQGQGDDVPQELAATVKQLHGLFGYASYKLADSLLVRGRPSSDPVRTSAQVNGAALNGNYLFSYQYVTVSPETPRTVHVAGLRFDLYRPKTVTTTNGPAVKRETTTETVAHISTDLDVREGQKTVVGKSSIGSGDAVILVIVPRIADEESGAQKK